MNLESQVCSLELSKRLKGLGVLQESYFYWWEDIRNDKNIQGTYYYIQDTQPRNITNWSAFTVAELGALLPKLIKINEIEHRLQFGWVIKDVHYNNIPLWRVYYKERGVNDIDNVEIFESETEADARAKMLIHLLEQGLINAL